MNRLRTTNRTNLRENGMFVGTDFMLKLRPKELCRFPWHFIELKTRTEVNYRTARWVWMLICDMTCKKKKPSFVCLEVKESLAFRSSQIPVPPASRGSSRSFLLTPAKHYERLEVVKNSIYRKRYKWPKGKALDLNSKCLYHQTETSFHLVSFHSLTRASF